MSRPTVFIVDDSAVVRKFLADSLTRGGLEVIGSAPDPLFALPKMRAAWPDVIVLDVEMPRMDGITFLKKIMALRPTPVVMCSTLTEKGADTTMQALAAGAVTFITKPRDGLKDFLQGGANDIVSVVLEAARANLKPLNGPGAAVGAQGIVPATARPSAPRKTDFVAPTPTTAMSETTDRVIAIGLSTGGVQAIERVLTRLPRTVPGIVIVQHMPERFTASFAARLATLCEVDVAEARDGDRVLTGRALIAPGGRHMRLARSGAQYRVEIFDAPAVNHHKPSVDVLFNSVAQLAGRNALGVIMTGMGNDGARGLRAMHDAGARTVAQDEASCVVYGMPKEAVALGAVDEIVPLDSIAPAILKFSGLAAALV